MARKEEERNRRNRGAAAEAGGTVAGTAAGAALGSVLGPAGTVAGAVAGGAMGNEAVDEAQAAGRNRRKGAGAREDGLGGGLGE